MAGNVFEWVNDWYDENYYSSSPYYNPPGPATSTGSGRVIRSGSWGDLPWWLRVAYRNWVWPDLSNKLIGFRCARSP